MIIQANPNEVEENSAGFTTDHEVTAWVKTRIFLKYNFNLAIALW